MPFSATAATVPDCHFVRDNVRHRAILETVLCSLIHPDDHRFELENAPFDPKQELDMEEHFEELNYSAQTLKTTMKKCTDLKLDLTEGNHKVYTPTLPGTNATVLKLLFVMLITDKEDLLGERRLP